MPKELYEELARLDVVERLSIGAKNGMIDVMQGEPFSAAEAVSACLTLTAALAEVMLAMSPPDAYGHNLGQVLKGIEALRVRVNPPGLTQ